MSFIVNGTVAALVAVLVQTLFKPLIELWIKPDAPNHDNLIRAVALVLGVALLAVDTLIGGPWPATGDAWLLLVGSGALSGTASIGIYHVLTGTPAVAANPVAAGEAEAILAPPAEKVIALPVTEPAKIL